MCIFGRGCFSLGNESRVPGVESQFLVKIFFPRLSRDFFIIHYQCDTVNAISEPTCDYNADLLNYDCDDIMMSVEYIIPLSIERCLKYVFLDKQ